MSIPRFIENAIQYVSEAVTRIFAPNDDAYPNIGVQPFDGEPNKDEKSADW